MLFFCSFTKLCIRSQKWHRQAVPFLGPCLSSFFEVFCIKVAEAQRFGFNEALWLMATGRATVPTLYWGGPFLRACFFLRFEDQKRAPSLSYCFASISIGLRPSRPASKPASKLALRCFVLISMVSRHWSSRLALRPAFNFVSSYKLLVSLQFPST